MYIYQDYQAAADKQEYILKAIKSFKASPFFRKCVTANEYYNGENTEILNRMQWMYNGDGAKTEDRFKANNRIPSGFFTKIVMQSVSYLLSNGVDVDEQIKDKLGRKFDVKLQNLGTKAAVEGVAYAYCYINQKGKMDMSVFNGREIIPLFDERTGQLMACIRFYQLEDNRPLYVELYEADGKSEYIKRSNDAGLVELQPKATYKHTRTVDAIGIETVEGSNFSVLPVFSLYYSSTKQSAFSTSLKNLIDLYDVILSDFGNNLEDNNDIYWVLKNYHGQDIGEFLADFKEYKVIKTDEAGDVSTERIEVPHEAREIALKIIKENIYDVSMALDTSILTGGSLTNVAIKSNMENLNLKLDDFENQVFEFLYNVIDLFVEFSGEAADYDINFIRRSIVNDSEVIDNIYKMRSDISHETALKLNPLIVDEVEELQLFDAESYTKINFIEDDKTDADNEEKGQ